MSDPKVIIFDMDDTLVESVVTAFKVHKLVAKKYYDLDLTDEKMSKYWGLPFDEMVAQFYDNKDNAQNISKRLAEVKKDFVVKPQTGAIEFVQKLKGKYILGVVTSANKEIADIYFTEAGFKKQDFLFFHTIEDTKFHKPDPRVFDTAIEKIKAESDDIKLNEIVYIGDSLSDYNSAKSAGFEFLAVTSGLTKKEAFLNNGLNENLIFDNVGEIDSLNYFQI